MSWILNKIKGILFMSDETPTTDATGELVPVDAPDPILDAFNDFFDAAVAICPSAFLDSQIRKAQGAFAAKWPSIKEGIKEFSAEAVDAAMKALWLAATGHPIAQRFIGVARGFIALEFDRIVAKAKPKMAAKLAHTEIKLAT